MTYQEALERTDPSKVGTVGRGSPEERDAIHRFKDLFSLMSEANIRANVRKVYAHDAYLNDTLKTLHGVDAIEAYFIETAHAAEEIRARFTDVAESQGNYYFRWTMDVKFKNLKKGQVTRSIGMSHIRFNQDGKVILHQDYWDSTSGLFEHIPVIGGVLRWLKSRF